MSRSDSRSVDSHGVDSHGVGFLGGCKVGGGLLALFVFVQSAVAEDAYFEVPIDQLKITAGKRLERKERGDWFRRWRLGRVIVPYAVLDGKGEVYLGRDIGGDRFRTLEFIGSPPDEEKPTTKGKTKRRPMANRLAIAIRVPKRRTVTGTLYLPRPDFLGMNRIRFSVAGKKADPKAKRNFYLTKSEHYAMLQRMGVPGGAWFRQQAALARSIVTWRKRPEPLTSPRRARPGRLSNAEWENTFRVFSGGRAISENLQLDRLLRPTKPAQLSVDLKTLPGITVAEMDWTKRTKNIHPQLDPLAKLLPEDQYALLFPSFRAMTQQLDEAKTLGTPLLHLLKSRAESARSSERYQQQLCLEISDLARLLGPKIIRSVAFTGSDPYLRTGTDVAILFEAKSQVLVRQYVFSKYALAKQQHPECKSVTGMAAGLKYVGVVSPQRRICSYLANIGDVVVVTNSLVQLERISATGAKKAVSLSSLPEYRFFRHRYRRGSKGESALLIVTDATIRRWCSPKWRIATSRRTRAAAVLSHHQAANLSRLVEKGIKPTLLSTNLYVPDLGALELSDAGVSSSVYGTLEFMTPISELHLDRVTKEEAKAYRRWRNSYQSYWRQFFDPIAVRFSLNANTIAADVTVMPLIEQSDYRGMIQLAAGATLKADAGDRHAGSLLHWAMAINHKATSVQRIIGFLPVNPLSWLGESIAVYVDADPVWLEFAKATNKEKFLENQFHRLPIAFRAEVKSGIKLALFLTGLRSYIEKAAPGMVVWKTRKHNGQAYVKLEATPMLKGSLSSSERDLALYYVATPDSFTLTLNENLLKRSIDRDLARRKARAAGKPVKSAGKPWLGSSVALQLDGKALGFFQAYFGENYRQIMQSRAWANLPVLNEWKRRYPNRNPVELHQQHWKIQLRCPGGGTYVWNEKFQTMASTVYGHPGEPKPGPKLPAALRGIRAAGFGLTFENKGLRARLNIQRSKR